MLQININILEMNVSESRISVLNWKEQTPTVVSSSSFFFGLCGYLWFSIINTFHHYVLFFIFILGGKQIFNIICRLLLMCVLFIIMEFIFIMGLIGTNYVKFESNLLLFTYITT